MTNHDSKFQQISELLDQELETGQSVRLLQNLESDPELAKRWKRYSLISEAMRSSRVVVPGDDFVAQVSQKLADEPVSFAPGALKRRSVSDRIVTAALAASLAVVAVMVARSVNEYPEVQGQIQTAANTILPANDQDDARLREYFVMHNETAYLSGAQGMLPYVRLASVKSGR